MYIVSDVMVRTQVYLSREQEQALKSLSITSGTRQGKPICEAVDLFLSNRNALQSQWKNDRTSLAPISTRQKLP